MMITHKLISYLYQIKAGKDITGNKRKRDREKLINRVRDGLLESFVNGLGHKFDC